MLKLHYTRKTVEKDQVFKKPMIFNMNVNRTETEISEDEEIFSNKKEKSNI